MKSKTKIWLGVGAFVVAGSSAVAATPSTSARPLAATRPVIDAATDTAIARVPGIVLAQHKPGGEVGELGGEKNKTNLPPDLTFALKIGELRGHLLVGDELVKMGDWTSAMPHFLHPTEEIYNDIAPKLKDYNVPPFEAALKTLADVVKNKKEADYAKALQAVNDALAHADAGLKAKQSNWAGFTTEAAVELAKAATGEYEEAIVKGKIANPVEYQDSRGFVWHAEKMIESVAPELAKKDAAALAKVRAGFAELKKAWPSPKPPMDPVKSHADVLGDVSRIEVAAGKLM